MHALDRGVTETPEILLAALERTNDGIVIVDANHHVSHFNAAAEQIWGIGRAEVLGRHVSALKLNELEHADAALTGQSPTAGVIREGAHPITIRRRDGDKVRAKFEDSVKNLEETWEDNKCSFAFRTYGMDFSGSMTVNDSDVEVDGNLPFAAMMFKGRIEKEVQGELDKLLA